MLSGKRLLFLLFIGITHFEKTGRKSRVIELLGQTNLQGYEFRIES
jgi:hypothetical protein